MKRTYKFAAALLCAAFVQPVLAASGQFESEQIPRQTSQTPKTAQEETKAEPSQKQSDAKPALKKEPRKDGGEVLRELFEKDGKPVTRRL